MIPIKLYIGDMIQDYKSYGRKDIKKGDGLVGVQMGIAAKFEGI